MEPAPANGGYFGMFLQRMDETVQNAKGKLGELGAQENGEADGTDGSTEQRQISSLFSSLKNFEADLRTKIKTVSGVTGEGEEGGTENGEAHRENNNYEDDQYYDDVNDRYDNQEDSAGDDLEDEEDDDGGMLSFISKLKGIDLERLRSNGNDVEGDVEGEEGEQKSGVGGFLGGLTSNIIGAVRGTGNEDYVDEGGEYEEGPRRSVRESTSNLETIQEGDETYDDEVYEDDEYYDGDEYYDEDGEYYNGEEGEYYDDEYEDEYYHEDEEYYSDAGRSDDASAADSDLAGNPEGIEGEVLDDSQLPTGESLAFSGDGDLEGPGGDYGEGVGEVEVGFQYSGENRRMNITIIRGVNLPPKEKGGAGSYRLRLVLFPSKKQRAKTRIRDGDKPEFKELFRFSRIYPHELVGTSIRIRLYGAERLRKERLIGEGIVKFSALNVSKKQVIRLRLKPQSELGEDDTPYSSMSDLSAGESAGSLQSIQHGGGLPELLVGLSYNSTTGRLAVEIIKGSHFKQLAAGRAPDSYVKVAVMSSSGFEMTKSKSSVRRGQPNPTFKETFIFQIAQFQLNEVTLMFTVFNKKGMKRKNAIGWCSMGLSNTSEEELAHWNEMQTSNGQQVCRWHALLESKA